MIAAIQPGSSDDAVIRVDDVRKAYGAVKAVDGVSFRVAKGEIFGLLGPNGAGKTTTMEMIEGLHLPDTGEIQVLGMDVRRHARSIKNRIGVQLQTAALYPQLTVAELLALFGSFYNTHLPVDQLIDDLDLGEKRSAKVKTLSGGQQQRLSVALAMINDPEVVFLDEPTTGLDPAARQSLWSVIRRLKAQGRTILMTTHYMEEAEALCDRLAIMDHGRVLDAGTADELIGRRFQERGVRFGRTGAPDEAQLQGLPGVKRVVYEDDEVVLYTGDVPATIAALLELTMRAGTEPDNLMIRRASLEDVFLELSGPGAARLMRALSALSIANLRSFVRDRAALFWTLFFPITFVILFGTIFAGGGTTNFTVGWVDLDRSPVAVQLRSAFVDNAPLDLVDGTLDESRAGMLAGDLDAILVVPDGLAAAILAGQGGQPGAPVALTIITDPSRSTTSQAIQQIATGMVMAANMQFSGAQLLLTVNAESLQTNRLNSASFFVPSILAMALMQLGIFAAIPLVEQRQKLILKRLNATPLPRWTLVGSNVVVRLLIAAAQTALIIGIGMLVLGVEIAGSWPLIIGFVALGSMTFTAVGYVIASFARTEESANGITQFVQLPMMFLSGIFFPLEVMPDWLRSIATLMPLTYLGDALRQVMVGGTPFAPLGVDALVLLGWLVVSLGISARFFRWQ